MKSKRGIILGSIVLLLALFSVFVFGRTGNDNAVVLKENVKIISSETDLENQLIGVTDDEIIFNKNPGYVVGDVIVSGITEAAPNGFIRRVLSVSENNGVITYETEYATLLDVFEEAHIIKIFAITNESVQDVEKIDDGIMTLNLASAEDSKIQLLVCAEAKEDSESPSVKVKPTKKGMAIEVALNEDIGDSVELSGELEIEMYLELKIDIADGEIDFGVAVHTDTAGELFAGYRAELFDKDNEDWDGEKDIPIFDTDLPTIEFMAGPVPVVITNDFALSAEIAAQLEGEIGTTVEIEAERITGFEYSSKTGEIREINEKNYLSDGMEWKTEARATGELKAGVYAHLVTKLYGSTGADLAVGIVGEVDGFIACAVKPDLSSTLYGSLEASVGPKIKGKVVASVPIVDYNLVEEDIFEMELPAFWERKWEIEDPILKALKKGDFSYFAGRYVATPEDNNNYGGGEKLEALQLNEYGHLSGGGAYYSKEFWPEREVLSAEKMDNGVYFCDLELVEGERSYRYTIYPVGVIENDDYVLKNQSYLRDVVYITCEKVSDSGALFVTYYSDAIENVVVGYRGVDWVSTKECSYEVDEKFVSGTGVEYTVIEQLESLESGRVTLILETKNGTRRMISDMPGFLMDKRTGIAYWDIYEYVEHLNNVDKQ